MSDVAGIIADMVRSGVDPELIGRAAAAFAQNVQIIQNVQDPVADRRRAYDRERKAAKKLSTGIPPESAETTGIKEVPQTPPENPSHKEKTLREKKKQVSRIPDDFVPDLDWAIVQGLSRAQAETQAATFRDFWTGAKDGSKADWPATWRNWVRKFIERAGISPRPEPQSDDETWRKRLVYARREHRWATEWGPKPGDPDCRAPPGLLEPSDGSGWGKWESAA